MIDCSTADHDVSDHHDDGHDVADNVADDVAESTIVPKVLPSDHEDDDHDDDLWGQFLQRSHLSNEDRASFGEALARVRQRRQLESRQPTAGKY